MIEMGRDKMIHEKCVNSRSLFSFSPLFLSSPHFVRRSAPFILPFIHSFCFFLQAHSVIVVFIISLILLGLVCLLLVDLSCPIRSCLVLFWSCRVSMARIETNYFFLFFSFLQFNHSIIHSFIP